MVRRLIHVAIVFTIPLFTQACAPARWESALTFYADRHRVRDAAARRSHGYWNLRFNDLILSDLDEAIRAGNKREEAAMRDKAVEALQAADRFGRIVAFGEIDRLPPQGRAALAERAGCAKSAEALKDQYRASSDAALSDLLADARSLPGYQLRRKLAGLRRNIEPMPDDRGRLARRLLLAWGAVPSWIGVYVEDAKLPEKTRSKSTKQFDRVDLWQPTQADGGPLARFAPTIVVESPAQRGYCADDDRIGEVNLFGSPGAVVVSVDTSRPVVYGYTSEAKINGRRFPQLVYVWWFPNRPAMSKGDPVAGRIDGDTLRITLDSQGRPSIFEVTLNCGCGHLVFVAEHLEELAHARLAGPEPGKTFAVERRVRYKPDLCVAATVAAPEGDARPIVYIAAGYHEVCKIGFGNAAPANLRIAETRTYQLYDYEVLDRLSLGDGVASMFGPDGLVHGAGRLEGYLFAPTGMLSAGQPRKRGTQRIRWDAYTFDDPHLLERGLHLEALHYSSSFRPCMKRTAAN